MKNLLDEQELENSSIVANSLMNRERGIIGKNSYSKEMKLDLLKYLEFRIKDSSHISWLDICCGSGKALIETVEHFKALDLLNKINIMGIDRVPMFQQTKVEFKNLRLRAVNINQLELNETFDLITCVHGLHYIGDKLELIRKAVSWLNRGGAFYATLDLNNLKLLKDDRFGQKVLRLMKQQGLYYAKSRKLLVCAEQKELDIPYKYIGADDSAGPNFTGQNAVDSYYEKIVVPKEKRK